MDVKTFPTEPWDLAGHAVVAAGLTDRAVIHAPPGTRPVTVGGRALVALALFVYEPPSPLTYREIMAATLVRRGLRPFVHITHIWVDSPASRDGGRALWAIPKHLADFEVTPDRYAARDIATTTLRRGRRLAVPFPARFTVAQRRDGRTLTTPVRGRVRISPARSHWTITGDGPLGHLTGFRPLVSVAIRSFRLRFGPARRG
ncbi:acetoacetate decarboxylase [Aeromicrobium phragmitis]|uniref:Acetoacetate decarboxylase n=1 Tax=Aeromicrobium phragmitis TaxID=2478914 RepID=A0A3L8PLC6_9ACTN|nr:acetoacetate decarboxylase family protein [Aeromicrobium phragmitis]RLV56167.1 acetoacetate decarboxylase [Aeromicrobium phragmitis]